MCYKKSRGKGRGQVMKYWGGGVGVGGGGWAGNEILVLMRILSKSQTTNAKFVVF